MNPLLKIAVLVTVSFFVISVGAFIIPLMQDPFESQNVDASNVTEPEEGFLLEYELPNTTYEFSGASLFVYSVNKTVNAYYLHDGVQEPLTTGEPYEIRLLSGNQSDHDDIGTAWCYLFDATDAVVDSYDAGRITFMVEMNKSALFNPYTEIQTDGKSYPDMSFTYWKPSTSWYTSLVCVFLSLFILSAIVTLILAVLMREHPDSQK
ncbi:MAG: hypothetical protein C5S46_05350 [Candidatus Methanomarinus sp.]|uniref:Uncharacterized protein n=1 Tax=Candidatus Methanomarinus sp. TaxID=3386244 RepID=A0AC61SAD1_9EURY|nr:MAG: hypothetical protein C5S41_10465 [ANME-2 cluster archaeon]TKY91532.1 MAG: hypothetical protein C5S46_05350 [ANME-2 cluster archaeon]